MILLMVMMIDVCMYRKQRGVQAAEGGERGGCGCEGPGAKQEGSVRLQAVGRISRCRFSLTRKRYECPSPSFGTS